MDRKTIRCYVDAAVGLGLKRDGDEEQQADLFLAQVVEVVRRTAPMAMVRRGGCWSASTTGSRPG